MSPQTPVSYDAKSWPFSIPQPWTGPFLKALSIILEVAMKELGKQQLLVTLLLEFSGDQPGMQKHGGFTDRERLQLSHISKTSQFESPENSIRRTRERDCI